MGSLERLNFRELLMPYMTIVQADLTSLFKSRLTYGWLIAGVFLEVITVLTASIIIPTSAVVTQGLSYFIYIWSKNRSGERTFWSCKQ